MSAVLDLFLVMLTCLAGGAGAAARWWCDTSVQRVTGGTRHWGTFVVNVVGSFLLGLLTGLLGGDGSSGAVAQVIGLGLLGGYTTFSASALQSVRVAGAEGVGAGLSHAGGTALACVVAALCGLQLG